MRRLWLISMAIALTAVATPAAASAASGSTGTDFWLGFPLALHEGTPSHELLITAPDAASGVVSVPGTAFSQGFAVTPGATTTVTVPASVEDESNNSVQTGKGIHVTADQEVAVQPFYADPGTSDGYLGLPTTALGTAYRVLDYPGNSACGSGQFEIVGTQAETTVTIDPSTPIGAHTAGVPYTVALDAGSAYLGQASGTSSTTGTEITADLPVAVLAGNSCAQVPSGVSAANFVVEEIPPLSAWGSDFSVLPFAGRTSGDELTLLGSQDGTSLTVDDAGGAVAGAPLTLAAGQAASFFIDESTRIVADKPILVGHFAQSAGVDDPDLLHPLGDPTMVLVPPRQHWAYAQTVSTPASGFASRYLNVTVATADLGSLRLDGAPVATSSFAPVGGDVTISGAQLPVSAGDHTIADEGPFGVEAYGFDPSSTDAFGWPGAWGDGSRAPVPTPPVAPPSAKLPTAQSSQCVVPKLKGKKLKAAKKGLKRADCKLGKVKGQKDKTAKVKKQSPKPGKVLAPGSKVSVKLDG